MLALNQVQTWGHGNTHTLGWVGSLETSNKTSKHGLRCHPIHREENSRLKTTHIIIISKGKQIRKSGEIKAIMKNINSFDNTRYIGKEHFNKNHFKSDSTFIDLSCTISYSGLICS